MPAAPINSALVLTHTGGPGACECECAAVRAAQRRQAGGAEQRAAAVQAGRGMVAAGDPTGEGGSVILGVGKFRSA